MGAERSSTTAQQQKQEQHPICHKHGDLVGLSDECCMQMGTWSNQIQEISAYISHQQQLSIGHSLPIAGSYAKPTWCDLNRLSYEEYVACECQQSNRMDYIGDNVTLECHDHDHHHSTGVPTINEVVMVVDSDYPCLPKVCSQEEAQILLLNNETYNNNHLAAKQNQNQKKSSCKITHVDGGKPWRLTPSAAQANGDNNNQQEDDGIHFLVFVAISILLIMVLAGAYLRTARGRRQRRRVEKHFQQQEQQHHAAETFDDEHYEDDLELSNVVDDDPPQTVAENHEFS